MDNFKIGDRVVCIDISGSILTKGSIYNGKLISDFLTLYKIYNIIQIDIDRINKRTYIKFNDIRMLFKAERFILLSEYRKMKINNLFV